MIYNFVILQVPTNLSFVLLFLIFFFFFNDTATTEIYTLSLHDALPISCSTMSISRLPPRTFRPFASGGLTIGVARSEEHTSELQSLRHLVCRLLLEKRRAHV